MSSDATFAKRVGNVAVVVLEQPESKTIRVAVGTDHGEAIFEVTPQTSATLRTLLEIAERRLAR